jgi:putative transposase
LGFTLLRPQTVAAKGSTQKKAEFKNTFEKTVKSLESDDHMLFMDEATFQYSASVTRKWAKRGQQPTVSVIGWRQKMHILGAVEPAKDIGYFSTCPTLKAPNLITFFTNLLQQYPLGKINIVLDNARVHHAKLVQHFISLNPRIHLIHLLPYSPDLNPIEKFWKFVRQHVTHNSYYPTFEEFQSTIVSFLSKGMIQ